MRRLLLTVGLCALFVLSASAAEITIVSWNVESGAPTGVMPDEGRMGNVS